MQDGILPRGSRALVVLARYPRPGETKTRLAATIGTGAAAHLHRAFLEDIRRRFADHPAWVLCWAYDPPSSPFVEEIAGPAPAFPQAPGDLGARMRAALATVFAGGACAAALIGSDVPHLPLWSVERSFRALAAGAGLVLGPAEDGGYVLIGARSVLPPLFEDMRWGDSSVLQDTIRAARRVGVDPTLLPPIYDVDDLEGLERLRTDILAGRTPELTATRAALERIFGVGYKGRNEIRRRSHEPGRRFRSRS